MTPYFYYVFNISLSCNIDIPSFIGNLWWVLLLGNHLKQEVRADGEAKEREQGRSPISLPHAPKGTKRIDGRE